MFNVTRGLVKYGFSDEEIQGILGGNSPARVRDGAFRPGPAAFGPLRPAGGARGAHRRHDPALTAGYGPDDAADAIGRPLFRMSPKTSSRNRREASSSSLTKSITMAPGGMADRTGAMFSVRTTMASRPEKTDSPGSSVSSGETATPEIRQPELDRLGHPPQTRGRIRVVGRRVVHDANLGSIVEALERIEKRFSVWTDANGEQLVVVASVSQVSPNFREVKEASMRTRRRLPAFRSATPRRDRRGEPLRR